MGDEVGGRVLAAAEGAVGEWQIISIENQAGKEEENRWVGLVCDPEQETVELWLEVGLGTEVSPTVLAE